MKRVVSVAMILILCFLLGCSKVTGSYEEGLALRQKLLDGNGCTYICQINADFDDAEFIFSLECEADQNGAVSFRVLSPNSLEGIAGSVDAKSGNLKFHDTVLAFPHLAQGEISPVCAPWLFYKILTGGYIRTAGFENGRNRLTIDDSFQGENICLELWLASGEPVWAEIVWKERKIITLDISQFRIL